MATLADLRARVRELTGDTTGARWPTVDNSILPLDHWINTAERHYCEATRCLRVDHVCTISASTQEYSPTGDGFLDGIHSSRIIYSATYEKPLTFKEPFFMGRASFLPGDPDYYFVRKILGTVRIGLIPVPSVSLTLHTIGWKVPEPRFSGGYALGTAADVSQIPEPVVFDSCYLAAALCFLSIKEVDGAARMRAEYDPAVVKGRRMFAARGSEVSV